MELCRTRYRASLDTHPQKRRQFIPIPSALVRALRPRAPSRSLVVMGPRRQKFLPRALNAILLLRRAVQLERQRWQGVRRWRLFLSIETLEGPDTCGPLFARPRGHKTRVAEGMDRETL